MGPRPRGTRKDRVLHHCYNPPCVLQWGRVQVDAETYIERDKRAILDKLQLGRVRGDAETRSRIGTTVSVTSFNGAA